MQVCRRYGMRAQERGICLTVGMQRLQQGRLAAALQWLGRAGDEGALAAAARPLVQSIAEHAAAPSSHSGAPCQIVRDHACIDSKISCFLISFPLAQLRRFPCRCRAFALS